MEVFRSGLEPKKASFISVLQSYLNPSLFTTVEDPYLLASALRADASLLKETTNIFANVYRRQDNKKNCSAIGMRMLAVDCQYEALGRGAFFKPSPVFKFGELEASAIFKSVELNHEFALLKKLHEAAPKYVAKPMEEVKDNLGRTIAYTMELINGMCLHDCLTTYTPELPKGIEDQMIDFIRKIQRRRLVHGDFHSYNILVGGRDGTIKVIDPMESLPPVSLVMRNERARTYEYVRRIWNRRREAENTPKLNVQQLLQGKGWDETQKEWEDYAEEKGISCWKSKSSDFYCPPL